MSTISNLPHPRTGLTHLANGSTAGSAANAGTAPTAGPPTTPAPAPGLSDRVDHLDALIWAAARTTDDPQLAVGKAREFAEGIFVSLVVAAGSGSHRLNCSVPTATGPVTADEDLRFEIAADVPAVSLPASGAEREVCELFALAHVSGVEATAILRTRPLSGGDFGSTFGIGDGLGGEGYVVRGWRLADGRSAPIDAAGMFAFCCSEASSGEPLPLDPTTRYADARALVMTPRPG
ncbi:hypothetical protein [Catenulispora subtropica]|uniref:Uncharacterized protein n=1 Tax=Catenulispora subtropica TaxID=450798 RepID=A0ABN2QM78_9ACTN